MTMQRQGWKPGDEVTLASTVYPVDLTFRISGEIPAEQDPRFWFHRTYLEEALRAQGIPSDQVGMIWARIDQAELVPGVMKQIDDMFRNSEAETESETERSFFQNFFSLLQGIIVVFLIVSWLVAGCIVFIAANTASMAVRERLRELAVLKAIGFRWRLLFGTLLGEAALLATVAGALGALLSLALTRRAGRAGLDEPQHGPPRGLHRHQLDARAGALPGVLHRHPVGRGALLRRRAAQRRRRPCARCSRWRCRSAIRCATSCTGACAPRSPWP